MTVHAKRDQVGDDIVSEVAPRTDVMDLQIRRTAALLAPPSVPHENFPAKLRVSRPIQPTARTSLPKRAHANLRRRSEYVSLTSTC